MRQTKNGAMLIEIDGDATSVEVVKTEVSRIVGESRSVRTLAQKGIIEIRGMAAWTDKDDVLQAFTCTYDAKQEEVNILNIRKTYGGTSAATVLVPLHIAEQLASAGRLKVGMVYCGVRICDKWVRCYRCLAVGHESRNCSGPNREKCCRRCGREGHFAAQCDGDVASAEAFRRTLVEESGKRNAAGDLAGSDNGSSSANHND